MPQNEISDYNETDASNVDITGIDVQENVMRPPAVNNAFRALQGALKRWFKASLFRLRDGTDQTKLLAFDLSGITTATTRTLTMPDASGTIALPASNAVADLLASTTEAITPANIANMRASPSDQETGTASNRFVMPNVQQRHPSAAKWWACVSVSGGTPTLETSYNVTSITDTATGRLQITIDTDFSSANWSLFGAIELALANQIFGTGTGGGQAVGVAHLSCYTAAAGDSDPQKWFAGGFGDQA